MDIRTLNVKAVMESVTNDVIAVILTVGVVSTVISGTALPEWMVVTYGTVIGFYFGNK